MVVVVVCVLVGSVVFALKMGYDERIWCCIEYRRLSKSARLEAGRPEDRC